MKLARLFLPLLLLAGGLMAGCPKPDYDCSLMDDLPSDNAGATVLLADVSASVQSGGTGPDYARELGPFLKKAVARGDLVSIGSFDGTSSTVRWAVKDEPTRSTAKRPENQEKERGEFEKCLMKSAREAADETASTDRTDIEGALGVASRATPGANAHTIVLATDGLSTTGCLDLTSQAAAGDPEWIDNLVQTCPRRPEWPSVLAGKNLIMVGIGQPADGADPPATGSVEFLRQLWSRVCTVARALSCDISTAPVGRRDVKKSDKSDPVVRFVDGGGAPPLTGKVVTLSSEELFDTGSADLRPGVEARLQPMVQTLLDSTPHSVQVVGHTDTRAGEQYNQDLSERRAASVARVLTAAGVPAVTSRGEGETGALCTREKLPGGDWNEPCLQRDRRVDIVVKTTKG